MVDTSSIQEHMPVIGADGAEVGLVDHVEGDRIKLTKSHPAAGGQHHYIPTAWIRSCDGGKVELSKPANEAQRDWQAA